MNQHRGADDVLDDEINSVTGDDVDGLDFGEADAAVLMGLDPDVLQDDDDPFADLNPQFRRFAGHIMSFFDPTSLPMMFRPFAKPAVLLLTQKLCQDPEDSRRWALEMISITVRDLEIPFGELAETCWHVEELGDGAVKVGAPLTDA